MILQGVSQSFDSIYDASRNVTDAAKQMAVATGQQSVTSEDIAMRTNTISQSISQTYDDLEQMKSVSATLRQMTEDLRAQADRFRT